MKIYQWSKIYTRYDKSINCEQQTHIFFLGNCYGRKISHSIKTDVRICEAGIHMRHLNEEQKVSTSIKNILRAFIAKFPDYSLTFLHSKIFPDFSQNSLTFPWPWKIKIFPDFSLTAGNPVCRCCSNDADEGVNLSKAEPLKIRNG